MKSAKNDFGNWHFFFPTAQGPLHKQNKPNKKTLQSLKVTVPSQKSMVFCLGPGLFSGALLLVSRSVNANQQIYNGFVPTCASINAPWSHEPNVLWHSNVPTLSSMSGHWFAERLDVGQNTFANPRNELPNLRPKSHGKKIRIPNSKKSLISKPPRNLSKKNPTQFHHLQKPPKKFEFPTHIKNPTQPQQSTNLSQVLPQQCQGLQVAA